MAAAEAGIVPGHQLALSRCIRRRCGWEAGIRTRKTRSRAGGTAHRSSPSRRTVASRTSASGRRRRNRIRGIRPIHSRQVIQRDTHAPAVGGRPDHQPHQRNHHRQAQRRMRTEHSEIDQDDHRRNWQPIADDGEGPRITRMTCEDQTAHGTAFQLGPPGIQPPLAAMRAALA
jgi:hypothetical protein